MWLGKISKLGLVTKQRALGELTVCIFVFALTLYGAEDPCDKRKRTGNQQELQLVSTSFKYIFY